MSPATASHSEKLAEIKAILRSLLISLSKKEVSVQMLNRLYKDEEGTFIPYWEFGWASVPDFLQNIPDTCYLFYNSAGTLCVRHVVSEKSAHVAMLVAKQKKPPVKKTARRFNQPRPPFSRSYYAPHYTPQRFHSVPATRPGYTARRPTTPIKRPPTPNRRPVTPVQRPKTPVNRPVTPISKPVEFSERQEVIPASRLAPICIHSTVVPPAKQTAEFSERQEVIPEARPRPITNMRQTVVPPAKQTAELFTVEEPLLWSTRLPSPNQGITSAEVFDIMVELRNKAQSSNNYGIRKCDILSGIASRMNNQEPMYDIQSLNAHLKELDQSIDVQNDFIYFRYDLQNSTIPKNVTNSDIKDSYSLHFDEPGYNIKIDTAESVSDFPKSSINTDEIELDVEENNNIVNHEYDDKCHNIESNSGNNLIKERTQIRLKKLIENHPEGIWCSELPTLYKQEYNIDLEYIQSGFNNITEFVAALPDIFLIVEPDETKRQMLLSAENKSSNTNCKKTLAALYNFDDCEKEVDPVPLKLSAEVCMSFIPEGYINLNESVDQILVSNLCQEEYIEVIVSEIFTPSFFWVRLRKNKKKFNQLMESLSDVYNSEIIDLKQIKVPQVILQPGLNVACIYANMWHRAIVKKVKPDGFVVVFFYDYGTVKTYNPNNLYFLHKKFTYLPAQAIPCGLHHVKPVGSNEWPIKVTHLFVTKVWDIPLVAIISSVNEENNTMMISLTDTSDDLIDVHINDWMVENGLAEYGKMGYKIPIHKLCSFDEMELLRLQDEEYYSSRVKRKHKSTHYYNYKHVKSTSNDCEPAMDINENYVDGLQVNNTHMNCESLNNEIIEQESVKIEDNNSINLCSVSNAQPVTDSSITNLVEKNLGLIEQTNSMIKEIIDSNTITNDVVNTKDNSSISFCPSSNVIEATSDSSSVITLVKENMELMKQTNTMIQAIILNMPSDVNKITDDVTIDVKSGTASNKISENQSLFSDPSILKLENFSKTFKLDLNKNSSRINISFSEVNSNENNNNNDEYSPNHEALSRQTPSSNLERRRSSVFSSVSQQSMFNNKMAQFQLNGSEENTQIKADSNKHFSQFTSVDSTFSKVENNNFIGFNCDKNFHQTNGSVLNSNLNISSNTSTFQSPIDSTRTSNCTTTTPAFTMTNLSEKLESKPVHIFHMENEGWVPASEFVDAFTNLKDQRIMLKLLQILKYDVNFKHLTRDAEPQLFLQLDKSALKVPREEGKIKLDFVLTLMPLRDMLQVLVKLDFLNKNVLSEAVPLMKKCKENAENVLLERFNNKILFNALNLLVRYKEFRRSLRQST